MTTGVKINFSGYENIFTKMRIWRNIDGAVNKTVPAQYIGEFEAADHWIDDGVMELRHAQYSNDTYSHFIARYNFNYVRYEIEFETASGLVYEYAVNAPSSMFSERLHCRDLSSPYMYGDSEFGIYYPDTKLEFMPPAAQVQQLMRNQLGTSYTAYGQQARRFYQVFRNNLFIGGELYLSGRSQYRYGPSNALNTLNNKLINLKNTEFYPEYDIIVKDVKWRMHVLNYSEAGSFGRIASNVSGYNYPYQAGQSYPMHILYSSSGYAYYQYSTDSRGDYTFTTTTSSTTVYNIPALTMRYAGPAA